ncbi:DNA topoisomerase III [Sporosarcina sp. BP05]|uniref:DNA topoisomerase III n=1 Tax=Sporosarcina sp. BP05 TaxID=2758726 RepID=UPI0016484CA9|nr:DNA topoisomerase III [Sporosarcina sp. BP05]
METVVLAEKPSQALAYARAFQKMEKKDGYFIVKDSILPNGEAYITYGFGHLVELAPPGHYDKKWEKWSLENLPISPTKFDYLISDDRKKQFNIVEGLLNKCQKTGSKKCKKLVIIGTDIDREGENIAWSIINKANAHTEDKTFKRLWINSLEKEAIREGFQNLRNGEDYLPFYYEAKARQISDWLIGMNGSVLFSLHLERLGITGNGAYSIGRVQTPSLYMIYKRQNEIENFKKEPYFELEANIKAEKGSFKATLSPSQRFNTKDEVKAFSQEKNATEGTQSSIIANVEKKEKKTSSPLLYSLSNLQSKINQQFKASATDTLKAVQGLYEAKLLTYPRTDTTHITEAEFNYLKNNLDSYKSFLGIEIESTQLEPRKRFVDNKKVVEHHAIVLTRQVPSKANFDKLPDLQQKIYLLVAKTTVAMFLPDYKFEETIIETQTGDLLFQTKGQVPLEIGWKQLFSKSEEKEEKDTVLPSVNKGEVVEATISLAEKETQPPKPYTEGTLITAMKTAGKTVDDEQAQELLKEIEGIGTEATRANVIETLKNRKYMITDKNNLVVTEKGKILCKAVEGEPLLTSAEMTAKWETYLKKIGRKEGSAEKFLENIQKFILHLIEKAPVHIAGLDTSSYEKQKVKEEEKDIVGKCPKCEGNITAKKSFYGCTNYPNCKFTLSDNFRKKKLTKTNVKDLLQRKETLVKNIKKADKTTYNANIKVNEKGYIDLVSFAK